MDKSNKDKVFLVFIVLVTSIIWVNSILPADVSSVQSGFVVSTISNILSFFNIHINDETLSYFIRKSAHFGQFFVLGIFWFGYLFYRLKSLNYIAVLAIIFCLATAVIDESLQLFSDGRAFQVTDIIIDLFGSMMSISALYFTRYIIIKKGEPI